MSALSDLYTIPQEHLETRCAAKITQIYEGTNEIQRLVIARTMR